MSAISDLLSSAFSELIYDKPPQDAPAQEEGKPPARKKSYEPVREGTAPAGSLAEFDRVLGMLESSDSRTKARGIGALGSISDENRIACVAIFSRNPEARKAAVKRLRGSPSLLAIIFSESLFHDTSLSALGELSEALGELKDEKALVTLACNHSDRKTRRKALDSVKDVKWLIEIAYSSRYEDSRWDAIERLKALRVDIDHEDLRQDDTLVGLADQLVKSSASEEEVIEDMRIMLENLKYLDNMSKGRRDEFEEVIRDNIASYYNILKSIATSSRHDKARDIALDGMSSDVTFLAEVAQHAEYQETASKAVDMLASLMSGRTEPQALALVASMSNDSQRRARAVARIDNPQMLKHVVKHSRFEDSRMSAAHKLASMIERIDDAESLRLVIAFARESKNRELAEKRIQELLSSRPAAPEAAPPQEVDAAAKAPAAKAKPRKEEQAPAAPASIERMEPVRAGQQGGGLLGLLRDLIGI
jgi:hypothetical protein